MRFLFQSVWRKVTSMLAFFLLFGSSAVDAQILDKSRLSWRVGCSMIIVNLYPIGILHFDVFRHK